MLRRGFLKRHLKAGWPDLPACMARAAQSSGVPFATLARAAQAARKALAECGQSTWIGAVSNDCSDSRNWLYSRLPRDGDTVVFESRFDRMDAGLDLSSIELGTVIVGNGCTIGKQGRTL